MKIIQNNDNYDHNIIVLIDMGDCGRGGGGGHVLLYVGCVCGGVVVIGVTLYRWRSSGVAE